MYRQNKKILCLWYFTKHNSITDGEENRWSDKQSQQRCENSPRWELKERFIQRNMTWQQNCMFLVKAVFKDAAGGLSNPESYFHEAEMKPDIFNSCWYFSFSYSLLRGPPQWGNSYEWSGNCSPSDVVPQPGIKPAASGLQDHRPPSLNILNSCTMFIKCIRSFGCLNLSHLTC